jgi:hypothetical protein
MRIKFEDWNECKKIVLCFEQHFPEKSWEEILNMISVIDKLPSSNRIKVNKMITALRIQKAINDNIFGYNFRGWLIEKIEETREMFEYYDVK